MLDTKRKALICGFVFSILFSLLDFSGKCECISNKIFRLHIIANSDSREDQELKLKVRDRILHDFGEELSSSKNMLSVKEIVIKDIQKIKIIAQDEVYKNGFNYMVDAHIVNMHFNTRRYNDITLPAGNYNALRIVIGNAQGKNWWCVMFPPLCLPVAQNNDVLEDVLNLPEYDIVSKSLEYEYEFKFMEIFTDIVEFVRMSIYEPLFSFFSDYNNFEYKLGFKIVEFL